MPRKFQPVKLPNEPAMEFNIRKQRAISDFNSETQLLKVREQRFKDQYMATDKDMLELIEKNYTGEDKEKLKEKWKNECQEELNLSSDAGLNKTAIFIATNLLKNNLYLSMFRPGVEPLSG